MTNIIAPVVHANGTPRAALELRLQEAYMALHTAYEMPKRTAPNPRDYPGTLELASDQHDRRLRAVGDLMDELDMELGMLGGNCG